MAKIDDTVRRETLYIASWVLILSAVMEAVFLISGFWDLNVLFGNILAAFGAVVNFLLMGISVQKAVSKNEKDAASVMKFSQSMRLLMLFVFMAVGVVFFNPIASFVPLFFPRIAVAFRPLFNKKEQSENQTDNE